MARLNSSAAPTMSNQAIDTTGNYTGLKDLNSDVIHEISYKFSAIDRDGPFKLMLVCKAWRALVLGSARLWTWVHIDDSISGWDKRLSVSLSLSKKLPLYIVLYLPFASLKHLTAHLRRFYSLEIDLSHGIKNKDAHHFIQELIGNPPPHSLRSLRWFRKGEEVLRPPKNLLSNPHLFGEHVVQYGSTLHDNTLTEVNYPFLTCLDLTSMDVVSTDDMPSFQTVIKQLSALPRLKGLKLKSNLINWDNEIYHGLMTLPILNDFSLDMPRPELTRDRLVPTAILEGLPSDPTSFIPKTFFSCLQAPLLRTISIHGVAGDIHRALLQFRRFPCLSRISLVVRHWQASFSTRKDESYANMQSIYSLKELSLDLEADNAWDFRSFNSDRVQIFLDGVFSMASNISHLSVCIYSVDMLKLFSVLVPRLSQLSDLDWKRSYSVSGWRIEDQKTLNDLPILPHVRTIGVNSYSDLKWFPFRCPQARRIIASGWDYVYLSPSTFLIQNGELIKELDIGGLDIRVRNNKFVSSPMQFNQLNSLRCNLSVIVHFPMDSAPCLRHLALLPYSEEDSIDELSPDVMPILMKARRIERLELFATRVIHDEIIQPVVDVYLSAIYSHVKRQRQSSKRNFAAVFKGMTFHLRILETPCYPDWLVLLDVMKLLYSMDTSVRLRALYLPGFPHPTILKAIVSALRGEFKDAYPELQP